MSCCYYNGAGNGSNCYELYDKTRISNDIQLFSCAADEMINLFGQKVDYYVNTTSLLSADVIYGEQPTNVFSGPHTVKLMINLDESALSISKFGFQADDAITAYITYTMYSDAFSGTNVYASLSQEIAPKSGDVFKMTEYGNDRINGRSGNFFEITQRRDQNVGENMNPLGGHYGWQIKAQRLQYSFQPGLPQETVNEQVNDDSFYGKLSSTITGEVSSVGKSYATSADSESVDKVLDMTYIDSSMYGTYDLNPNN